MERVSAGFLFSQASRIRASATARSHPLAPRLTGLELSQTEIHSFGGNNYISEIIMPHLTMTGQSGQNLDNNFLCRFPGWRGSSGLFEGILKALAQTLGLFCTVPWSRQRKYTGKGFVRFGLRHLTETVDRTWQTTQSHVYTRQLDELETTYIPILHTHDKKPEPQDLDLSASIAQSHTSSENSIL